MVNYKPHLNGAIFSGIERHFGYPLVHLTDPTSAGGAADTMIKAGKSTADSTGTGKHFYMVGILIQDNGLASGSSLGVYSGATENAQTTLEASFVSNGVAGWYEYMIEEVKFSEAAGFVVILPTAGHIEYVHIIGYEA